MIATSIWVETPPKVAEIKKAWYRLYLLLAL